VTAFWSPQVGQQPRPLCLRDSRHVGVHDGLGSRDPWSRRITHPRLATEQQAVTDSGHGALARGESPRVRSALRYELVPEGLRGLYPGLFWGSGTPLSVRLVVSASRAKLGGRRPEIAEVQPGLLDGSRWQRLPLGVLRGDDDKRHGHVGGWCSESRRFSVLSDGGPALRVGLLVLFRRYALFSFQLC